MKEYTDLQLVSIDKLVEDILIESDEQVRKWNIQTKSLPEWMLYATEEVGELADAILEFTYREGNVVKAYSEAIQVVTLYLKIAEIIREKFI